VRQRIQRAHVLVHTSHMEGGAHVIMEAITSGTPVLASRIPGNVGMLGEDYAGYFPPGDAAALADLLRRCATRPDAPGSAAGSVYLRQLKAQCARRAVLFAPAREQRSLHHLIQDLLACP
jgi:glycosyltransferase involved in cell wall biosynthesis